MARWVAEGAGRISDLFSSVKVEKFNKTSTILKRVGEAVYIEILQEWKNIILFTYI